MSLQESKTRWELGTLLTAPAQNTALVTKIVSQAKKGRILGFWLSTTDTAGNQFTLNWKCKGVAHSQLIIFGGSGTIKDINEVAINEDYPADPQSAITITNAVTGTALTQYQASLLVAEVE